MVRVVIGEKSVSIVYLENVISHGHESKGLVIFLICQSVVHSVWSSIASLMSMHY